MNTSKQINIMVLLVFVSIIATGAYTIWDPQRSSQAETRQTAKTVEYGAYLFSQNCIVCHGNKAQGGAVSNRLKQAPPLNRPDLQGKDPKTGQVSAQAKSQAFKLVVNTITCGRIGKAMPTWGQSQGGTLSDEQIRQLATLITEGTGWDMVDQFAVRGLEEYHINGYASDGYRLAEALDPASTTVKLNKVDNLDKGVRLEIDEPNPSGGAPIPEIMLITDKPNIDDKTVVVERGVGTTNPVAHPADAEVLKPPVPPDPPPVTQPACGQNLPPAIPTAGAEAPQTNLTIIGQGTAFDKEQLSGVAGQPLNITFDNRDAGIAHNIHFFNGKDATAPDIASTEVEAGPAVQNLTLNPLEPGAYFYRCDVHPGQMEGTLTTLPAGAAAAATPAAGATETAQTPGAGAPGEPAGASGTPGASAGGVPTAAPSP